MPDLAVAKTLFNTLNHAHGAVNVTMKVEENGMLPFLGVHHVLKQRLPLTQKKKETWLLLHYYHSYVDSHYKQGLLITTLEHAHRLSSSWPHFSEVCECLREVFCKLPYPNHLIDFVINRFTTPTAY